MRMSQKVVVTLAASFFGAIVALPAQAGHRNSCHHFDETSGSKCMDCMERVWTGRHWKLVDTCKHHHGTHPHWSHVPHE